MKRISLALFCALFAVAANAQQEPQYSQNQFNSNLMINPAYAGAAEHSSIGLRYRKQWVNMDGSPRTISLIAEGRAFSERLGLGLCIDHDQIGIDRSISIDANIAYHLPVSETGRLAMGFKGGAAFLKSDYSKLVGISPGDPLYGTTEKYTAPYIGVGLLYYTDRYYAGISSPRLISFGSQSPRSTINAQHYFAYGGLKIDLDEHLQLRPALLVKYQPKAPLTADIASDLWYNNRFGFGLAYRTGDAINFMLKLRLKQTYFGYSYDMSISKLHPFNSGSHEFFIGFEFGNRNPDDPMRANNIRYF